MENQPNDETNHNQIISAEEQSSFDREANEIVNAIRSIMSAVQHGTATPSNWEITFSDTHEMAEANFGAFFRVSHVLVAKKVIEDVPRTGLVNPKFDGGKKERINYILLRWLGW